jgi:hypothetical protein
MTKAFSQIENYLPLCSDFRFVIVDYLRRKYGSNASVRPQGIIIAGNTQQFHSKQEKDDFRRLSLGMGHARVMAYDEC